MKSIKKIIFVPLVFFCFAKQTAYSQAFEKILTQADYSGNFINLSNKINHFYDTATGANRPGNKQWKRYEWFALNHLSEDGKFDNYLEKNASALKVFNLQKANYANAPNSVTGNWINIGHSTSSGNQAQQGRVNSIAFDPVNGDIIYVAAAGGGIWKSTNGGSVWTNSTVDLPILGIADIAVAPAPNNNIIYALSGEGLNANIYFHKGIGVLKSIDAGITWQTTGPINTLSQQIGGNKILIHPNNPNYVLAAMSNGLWRTTDGGNTWVKITFGGDVIDIEFKPDDLNILYYTRRNSNTVTILNLSTLDEAYTNIVPQAGTPGVTRMEIAVTPANGSAVYVLAGPGYVPGLGINLFYGLYYSSNSGSTFTRRTNQCSNNGNLFGSPPEQSWYDNTIYVNPNNENNVIIGGVNLFNSFDGGTTLNQIIDPDIHADQHNIKRNTATGDLWLCNDGGIYKSINNGTSWTNLSAGLIINEYYRISGTQTNADNLIGGLQDNGHFLREVGLNNYVFVYGGDGMDNYFNSDNNNIVYACFQFGGLGRSTDGGHVFAGTSLPNAGNITFYDWIAPIVQHPPGTFIFPHINTDVIYVYSQNGIMQSQDGGVNWTNMGPGGIGQTATSRNPSMVIGSNDMGISANLYISNGNNFLVHTNPLAATPAGWISRPIPISIFSNTSAIAVNPADKNEVWVTISDYNATQKVFRSTNAGVTWTNMTLSLPNTPVYSIVFANKNNNPGGAVYIGTEIGVFYKDNNLPNWVPFSNNLPHVPVTDLQMNYVNNTLKAATYGRGIWQSDLFQYCSPTITINYNINQGQFNFEASGTITANKYISGGIGTRVTMKAGNRITFSDGFKASYGSYTRATIGSCGSGVLSKPGDSLHSTKDSNAILSTGNIPVKVKIEEE
jgi:photosystem II stability/assembly factor-like uncharacterized protein